MRRAWLSVVLLSLLLGAPALSAASRKGGIGVFHPRAKRPPAAWKGSDFLDLALTAYGKAFAPGRFEAARRFLHEKLRARPGRRPVGPGWIKAVIDGLGPEPADGLTDEEASTRRLIRSVALTAETVFVRCRPVLGRWAAGSVADRALMGSMIPRSSDPLADELLRHLLAIQLHWQHLDRIVLTLSMDGCRARSPGWFVRTLRALRDPRGIRTRGFSVVSMAADLPNGVLVLFIRSELTGQSGPFGGDRLSALGALDAGSTSLGEAGMKAWLSVKLRRHIFLTSVPLSAGPGVFKVPVSLALCSRGHSSFLTDLGRSPWKILTRLVSIRPEVSSSSHARLRIGVQTLRIFSEFLPPWARVDVNARFVFGTQSEDGRNVHEMNLLGGTHVFLAPGPFARRESSLVSLFPAYARLHLHGTLRASQDWRRQEVRSGAALSLFFPYTPFDLLGLGPKTPRAVHESFLSLTLNYGAVWDIAGRSGDTRHAYFHMDLQWSQPLPLEFMEMVREVIGNDEEDSRRARKRRRKGDELSFPMLVLRWRTWWEAPFEKPGRFSCRRGFHSYVELELKIPMGKGFYAILGYADGTVPLSEQGTSELRTGIELTL